MKKSLRDEAVADRVLKSWNRSHSCYSKVPTRAGEKTSWISVSGAPPLQNRYWRPQKGPSSPKCSANTGECPSRTTLISRYSSFRAWLRLTQMGLLGSCRSRVAASTFHHDVACTRALPPSSMFRRSTSRCKRGCSNSATARGSWLSSLGTGSILRQSTVTEEPVSSCRWRVTDPSLSSSNRHSGCSRARGDDSSSASASLPSHTMSLRLRHAASECTWADLEACSCRSGWPAGSGDACVASTTEAGRCCLLDNALYLPLGLPSVLLEQDRRCE
mmetsp:Transcript_6403/g.18481  ORF Transcript_6403/g.18481 Transcript_6403/m.18481 type:complete len:274 (+) Transcript_6403:307-1128(+)